jgi:sensor domain CHASE-containing protein
LATEAQITEIPRLNLTHASLKAVLAHVLRVMAVATKAEVLRRVAKHLVRTLVKSLAIHVQDQLATGLHALVATLHHVVHVVLLNQSS